MSDFNMPTFRLPKEGPDYQSSTNSGSLIPADQLICSMAVHGGNTYT